MTPVDQFLPVEGAQVVIYAENQPEYVPLPALVWPDGKVMTEWEFSEEERDAIARGENLRLWIWTFKSPLQPIALEVTNENQG